MPGSGGRGGGSDGDSKSLSYVVALALWLGILSGSQRFCLIKTAREFVARGRCECRADSLTTDYSSLLG